MKFTLILLLSAMVLSCSEEKEPIVTERESPKETVEKAPVVNDTEGLIEIVGNVYTEYYPGKEAIKFQGKQNENGERQGKWLYYSESGVELSITSYENGKKEGHSIVKYPNGAVNYFGEYKNDKPVGVWETYSPEGKLLSKKDYGSSSK